MCGAGEPLVKDGVAIHMYACNAPMADRAFCNADGEMLIVPQLGVLHVTTELGKLCVAPGEIVVVPRNIYFAVSPSDASAAQGGCRGYVCEVFATRGFILPDLGPIGANGLAEPRDFLHPLATYEDRHCPNGFRITTKYAGKIFETTRDYSPWDVVAWHGTFTPYKYDLARYHAVNTVTVDHPDPSIFTVLTCPSGEPGVAVCDFVIFPPRWMCAQNTFRPPYFHRNVMAEFMGLIHGSYDAKEAGEEGFAPGGASLHPQGTPHGPDADCFAAASSCDTSKARPRTERRCSEPPPPARSDSARSARPRASPSSSTAASRSCSRPPPCSRSRPPPSSPRSCSRTTPSAGTASRAHRSRTTPE